MNFLAPIYFWTLLGLIIPLLIHLWNRKKINTIKIGSIQLLKESNPKQARSFRLNEWVLLFLRMLMIGVLTFLLVGPALNKPVSKAELTVIIEPRILLNNAFSSVLDTFSYAEIRLLQPGLPIYEKEAEIDVDSRPNYWQLAQEMEELAADSIVVFTNALTRGIKGIRPSSSSRINWVLIPASKTDKHYLSAQKKGDSIQFLIAHSENQHLSMTKENISLSNKQMEMNKMGDSILFLFGNQEKLSLKPETTLEVAILFEEETAGIMQLCKASLGAMGEYLSQPIRIQSVKNEEELDQLNYDLVIFLNESPIDLVTKKKLIYQPDSTARHFIEPGRDKTTFLLTKQLNTSEVLSAHFPEKLWKIVSDDEELSRKIDLADERQMDLSLLKPKKIGKEFELGSVHKMPISPWLWILFIMIFVAERILSKVRRQ
ncbi:MAG: BatA domain-containing protein [Lutimonas sp.]